MENSGNRSDVSSMPEQAAQPQQQAITPQTSPRDSMQLVIIVVVILVVLGIGGYMLLTNKKQQSLQQPVSQTTPPAQNQQGGSGVNQTPTTSTAGGSLSQMPMLFILLGDDFATYYEQIARSTDIAVIPAQTLTYYNRKAVLIPDKVKGAGIESWTKGQTVLPSLQGKATYIVYDPEHWPNTPTSEQNNIVSTVQNMSQAVHAQGFKYIISPDQRFDRESLPQLSPYADIVIIQGQRLEANPSDYQSKIQPLINAAKQGNPNVKVFILDRYKRWSNTW